jgi:N-acetylglucosamine kinase-like BadF-type ATPase
MDAAHLVVALEGGGSKTVALAVDRSGRVVASGRGGSSLALYVGEEGALQSVEDAIAAVADSVDPASVVVVAGAMVGKGFSADPADAVGRRFPGARLLPLHEGDAALLGATLETVGAVALAGTGAFGRAVGEGGREGHVGGNGPLVGDEGSGHWIAVEAIRHALWSRDGRGPATVLEEDICRHYGLERLGWIIGRLYGPRRLNRHEIASLAPVVVEAHRRQDAVAGEILAQAARLLAAQVIAAIARVRRAGDGWSAPLPFGCTGGVLLGSPELRSMVAEEVAAEVPEIAAREPALPPVGGVALEALRALGVPTDEALVQTLADSLPAGVGGVRAVVSQTN